MQTVLLSFQASEGLSPAKVWVGFDNYRQLVETDVFWQILIQTLVWTVAVVGLTVVSAWGVAHILQARFRGRGLFRVILLLPWATSLALSAVVWRFALQPEGLANESLSLLGLGDVSVAWLADVPEAAIAVVCVGIWVSVPFAAVMLAAAMRSIPIETYQAAELDGAGAFARSWFITLPMVRRILAVVALSNVVVVFNSFPIIFVMTGGGPVNKTDILATYLYRLGFSGDFDIGAASAIAVLILLLLLVMSIAYVKAFLGRRAPA